MSGIFGGSKGGGGGGGPHTIAGLQVGTSTYGLPIPIIWGQNRIHGNLLWYGNFAAHPIVSRSSGGKGGGGSRSTVTGYTYTAAGLFGLCEGPIQGVAQVWSSKNATTLGALGVTLNAGAYPQSPWGYLTTNFPSQAIGYSGVANVCSGNFQLSSSAQVPNILYEVQGLNRWGSVGQTGLACTFSGNVFTANSNGFAMNECVRFTTSGTMPTGIYAGVDYYIGVINSNQFQLFATPYQPSATSGNPAAIAAWGGSGALTVTPYIQGANPADVVTSFITDPVFGVNGYTSSAKIPLTGLSGTASSFANYCVANGIFISPVLASQVQASHFIMQICDITNSVPVWSQGNLTIIPYGDTPASGNGAVFIPNTTVQFTFTDDDFLDNGHDDPIVITRSTPSDAFNQVQINFPDRTNQYNPNVAQATDQANIDLYGLRPMPQIHHDYITDSVVARNVAQIKLQRVLYVRNQYEFKVGWKYAALEPMDLVSITDVALGLNGLVVRVTKIEEDSDETLTILAEDYLVNNATVQAVAPPQPGGAIAQAEADPGLCATPVIFDAPGMLTTSGFEVWLATAGGDQWGGCQVWVSTDDTTYASVGVMHGGSRYGQLSANYPAGSDPDTTDNCSVDLTISAGVLTSGAAADADNYSTLALIYDAAPEIIAFSTATLTGTSQYNLTTYTRRGIYGSSNAAHGAGSPFVRLDDSVFKFAYDPAWRGKTIYIKLLPFNLYGGGLYTLAMVSPATFTIDGSISYPPDVTGYSVGQNGVNAVFAWQLVQDPDQQTGTYISGYDLRYNPYGFTDWVSATPLSRVNRGTEITTAALPPGHWTTLICAIDQSGNYSHTPTRMDIVMANGNQIIISAEQDPDWLGTLSGLVKHWTGVLVVDSTELANVANTDGSALNDLVFAVWVWNPVASYSYITPEYNVNFAATIRLHGSIGSQLGLGVTTGVANPLLSAEYSNTSGSYPNGFLPWTVATVTAQYFKMQLSGNTANGLVMITSFDPVADVQKSTQTGSATIINASTGIAVTFSPQFHLTPLTTLQSTAGTGLIPDIISESATGFTAKLFNNSGVSVTGSFNWLSIGE